ncbi:MAG: alpha/beta hydrolase family protein [Planctomycetaceae bacterium]
MRTTSASVLLLLALVAAGCSLGTRESSTRRAPTLRSVVPPAIAPPPTQTPSRPVGPPFTVGTVRRVFTDTSRTVPGTHTVTGMPGPRVLPTLILYPAEGPGGGPVPGATPAGHGFPLVVFAPGFDRGPSSYRPLLRSWARAGYVVAAVTFPLTNPNAIGGLDEYDIVHQPADVRFVITQMLRATRTGRGILRHLVDPAEIAVAGHSDGAQTAILVGAAGCCRDPRVDAIVPMAGANLPAGTFFASPIPTLVMQGTADPISPEPVALHVYAIAKPPKYLLLLRGADHLEPFAGAGPWERVVSAVSIAFLDRYLEGASIPIEVPAAQRRLATLTHVGG